MEHLRQWIAWGCVAVVVLLTGFGRLRDDE
jgi:uncharacterized membrane protein YjfL (UPF0719 family)